VGRHRARRTPLRVAGAAACVAAAVAIPARPSPAPALGGAPPQPKVLVLYDSSGGDLEGEQDAISLENLLGHFRLGVQREPVTKYVQGQMQASPVTFYIGSVDREQQNYKALSPERAAYRTFLKDAGRGSATLVWMGLNLGDLVEAMGPHDFSRRYGMVFEKNDTGYNRVVYKGVELTKGVIAGGTGEDMRECTAEGGGFYDCDLSLGLVKITHPASASVVAQASSSTVGGHTAPYVTHAGNLWYVGDLPFSYVDSGEDRYLAFADLLHNMVGIHHAERHRALVRLEDVHPREDVAQLDANAAVLARHHVPFGVATIPFYRDVKNEPGVEQGMAGSEVGAALARYVREDGASIVQHGTTHQWDGGPNPDTGSSGPDYEFYRVGRTPQGALDFIGPVPGDSPRWATDRIRRGGAELARAGLTPFAWEAPHYLASDADYRAIAAVYPVQWGGVSYFGSSTKGADIISQTFPYEVHDVYGETVIPEDLGFMKPDTGDGRPPVLPADIIRAARKTLVVRDGFASFFFHPYLDAKLLDETITGIEQLGYRFASGCSVVGAC